MSEDQKITCQICGDECHAIVAHLKKKHPEVSPREYQQRFPSAPMMSAYAQSIIAQKAAQAAETVKVAEKEEAVEESKTAPETPKAPEPVSSTEGDEYNHDEIVFFEAFGLDREESKNARGDDIKTIKMAPHGHQVHVPSRDPNYIWNVELAKDICIAMEMNIPAYFWGHAGTGKSTMVEQCCSITNRPMVRVQHTANTEESHIVGQTLANESGTYFEPGLLALAMKHGWVYLADEYDFAFPQVLGVYQPVLEGKPLIIKEAPPEWRRIEPHPEFRFIATGNTNGAGDETGLYLGTNLQNAANYSRFGICTKVNYLDKETETNILVKKAKGIKEDMEKIVEFAIKMREAYEGGNVSNTIGPREMLYAAQVGIVRGNIKVGIEKAYISKLPTVSVNVASEIVQRIFGDE